MQRKGFVDLHIHGFGGFDTNTADPEDIVKMAESCGRAGSSAILPTVYSAPLHSMRLNMEAVKRAREAQKQAVSCQPSADTKPSAFSLRPSTILGVHLEGPFLNPLRCGALDKDTFIRPSIASLGKLIDGYEEMIKIITIAPEMPGALKLIESCVHLGIRVNMGHSDATLSEAESGKKAGATGITHLFNAMRPFHHREPGISGFGLLDDDLSIEVIADGFHLHPETLKLIFRSKRLDKIILVSDSVKDATRGGKPIYRGNALAGSGAALSDSAKVLKRIGISEVEIRKIGMVNPERYVRNG